ncbi:MAG: Ig-like domain-containing protein [Actinomycetota bacterium]|nr:Ig-like domain-containing protein [Actinomycetota bacterium]
MQAFPPQASSRALRPLRAIIVVSLVAGAFAVAPPAQAAITLHLWSMDEPPGAGSMLDSGSPSQTDGTWQDITGGVPGVTGTAYRFNGSSSRVVIGDDPSLDVGSDPFTATAHVRFTVIPSHAIGGDYDLIRKGLFNTPGGFWKVEIFPASDFQRAVARCTMSGSVGIAHVKGAPYTLNDGTWHDISCSRTDAGITLVVDGTRYQKAVSIGSIQNDAPVTLGAKSNGSDWYHGDMDETSLQIGATNSPPTAFAATASTTRNTSRAITLAGRDADTCELTFLVQKESTHGGSITGLQDDLCTPGSPDSDTASVSYTPPPDFVGQDSFMYQVQDDTYMDSSVATVTINVRSPISLQGSTWGGNRMARRLRLGAPSGLQVGDVLLAEIAVGGAPRITPPTGWIQIRTDASDVQKQSVFYKVATDTEPTTYIWRFSRAKPAAGGILDYRGVDASDPIDAKSGRLHKKSTRMVARSVTTTVSGDVLVAFFDITKNNSVRAPRPMTERFDQATKVTPYLTVESADQIRSVAGRTGKRVARAKLAGKSIGQLVALRPQ